jgi:hypothetical protein
LNTCIFHLHVILIRWGVVVIYFYVAAVLAWRIDTMLAEADAHYYDVAGTAGGALTCLTVPLAVYLVSKCN